jgi:aminomethyltransferase
VYTDDHAIDPIGTVTSGGFGPTLDSPVAMGMLDRAYAQIDRQLFAEVRGKRLPVRVCSLPFITPSYKRA